MIEFCCCCAHSLRQARGRTTRRVFSCLWMPHVSRLGRWMNGAGDEHHMHNCQVSRLSRVLEDLSHVLLARTRQPVPCLEWSGRCKSAALERRTTATFSQLPMLNNKSRFKDRNRISPFPYSLGREGEKERKRERKINGRDGGWYVKHTP